MTFYSQHRLNLLFLFHAVPLLVFATRPAAANPPEAQAMPLSGKRMEGPYARPDQLCARFKRAVCANTAEPELPHRSRCTVFEVPLTGTLEPPFLAVRAVTALCKNGLEELTETHLAVQMKEGWFFGSDLPAAGFQHHTEEHLSIRSLEMQHAGDAPLLAVKMQHSCNLAPIGGDADHNPPLSYSRTAESELLMLIGLGQTGRPSAILRSVGSAFTFLGIPEGDSDRALVMWKDAVSQNWLLLSGPLLQLNPPQVTLGAHQRKSLLREQEAEDAPCFDGSVDQRRKDALRQVGSHPLLFR